MLKKHKTVCTDMTDETQAHVTQKQSLKHNPRTTPVNQPSLHWCTLAQLVHHGTNGSPWHKWCAVPIGAPNGVPLVRACAKALARYSQPIGRERVLFLFLLVYRFIRSVSFLDGRLGEDKMPCGGDRATGGKLLNRIGLSSRYKDIYAASLPPPR